MKKPDDKQSASRYIYNHLAEIEKMIAMGVYHDAVCAELVKAGLNISLPSFRKALARARQKNRRALLINNPNLQALKVDVRKIQISGKKLSAHEFDALQNAQIPAAKEELTSRSEMHTRLQLSDDEILELTHFVEKLLARKLASRLAELKSDSRQ